jgi:S1-C subfamily serine protease
MIRPAPMAFVRTWQVAPAAYRLVGSALACVAIASCAGGAPSPPVSPARASLTRFTTAVSELRQRMEADPDSVEFPEGVWSLSAEQKQGGEQTSSPDFSSVLVVRDPSDPRKFLEMQISDSSSNPEITATFSALAQPGIFVSEQFELEGGTSSTYRFRAEDWTRFVGARTEVIRGRSMLVRLIYDRVWPLDPSPRDHATFAALEAAQGSEVSPERPAVVQGSGLVLPSGRAVATNYHVVDGASRIEVRAEGGEWIEVHVARADIANDLAILEIPPDSVLVPADQPPYGVRIGRDAALGAEVHVVGFPMTGFFGSNSSFTTGTVSALEGFDDDPRLLQVTTTIQPGTSGGPLVDSRGRIMGIAIATANSSLFGNRTGVMPENSNFAMKIDYLVPLAGEDFGNPGGATSIGVKGSEIAALLGPWVVQVRASR